MVKKAKVLVSAIGSDGDINPMIEIAKELAIRGHNVEFCANGHFAKKVKDNGLTFIELGDKGYYEQCLADPDAWDPLRGFSAVWRMSKAHIPLHYDLLKSRMEPNNTILVGSTISFASRILQETDNLKLATVHLSPCCLISAYDPPAGPHFKLPVFLPLWLRKFYCKTIEQEVLDKTCKDDLNAIRKQYGLGPVANVFTSWLHSPNLVVCAFPEWFAAPQPDWPKKSISTNFVLYRKKEIEALSIPVREFIEKGDAPLVFTAGSAMAQSKDFFEKALQALAGTNWRAIFVSNFADQIPASLPENVIYTKYEPFDLLFANACAVIHHGGIGTSAQCLNAGKPQLIIPFSHDQFDNANRLRRLGVAKEAHMSDPTDKWCYCLKYLLASDKVKTACKTCKFYMDNAPNPVATIADAIEALISG